MSKKLKYYSLFIIFGVLLFDQVVKIWIKTHMHLGQEFNILGDWFIIHFTENNGMAFGAELFGDPIWGKLILSLVRIIFAGAIAWYIWKKIKENAPKLLIICVSLIFAGAVGNILDSAIYGVLFSKSGYTQASIAAFLPEAGGYAPMLYGKVVDMLYFPLFSGHFPDWFPFWAGEEFVFFRPVFNIADAAITVGAFIMIFFHKRIFEPKKEETKESIFD